MDFTIPEDLKMIQSLARRFIQEELLPLEREVEEKGEFPDEIRRRLRKKAVDLGFWSYQAPVEYGGGGVGLLGAALIAEEVGKVSQAVGLQGGVIGEGRETRLLDANEQQRRCSHGRRAGEDAGNCVHEDYYHEDQCREREGQEQTLADGADVPLDDDPDRLALVAG